jgi:hypothetical protein
MTNEWDDGDEDQEEEEFGPDDPDYDLSEAHGYNWDPDRANWPVPPWLLATISVVVVASLVLPTIFFIMLND